MQVKEYKTPEEALKEVTDPIIRSAIEPLSDRVAKMIKNAENLKSNIAEDYRAKENEQKQD